MNLDKGFIDSVFLFPWIKSILLYDEFAPLLKGHKVELLKSHLKNDYNVWNKDDWHWE